MLAEAAWWSGRPEEVLEVGERAYAAYLAEGNLVGAAMAAWELCRQYIIRGSMPMVMAWMSRVEQIAADAPDSPVIGYVEVMRGMMAAEAEGDFEKGIGHLEEAVAVAERTGDLNLLAMSLHVKGRTLCGQGNPADGMALMDEAMVSVVGGQLEPITSGIIYCSMIAACSDIGDYRRAAEWTEVTTRWCERFSISGFPGVCRVHRAEILRLRGDLPNAEAEARQACDELPRFNFLNGVGLAFYEIGEVRRRMGDFAGAEGAYGRAHEHGTDPQPGLSMLRLAQGKPEVAAAAVERALADTLDRLQRVRLLQARADIALATGDLEVASAASEELDTIAFALAGTAIEAVAACVRGSVRLAEGAAESALGDLRSSLRSWLDIDAPFESAEVRMLMARAYQALGDHEAAALEARTARSTFERLGAAFAAERAGALLGELAATGEAPERVRRALMFTDIVRSTDLVGVIGDEAWEDLLAWHDQTLRSLFAAHGGEVAHHTGDGFFVAFENVESAVRCATAVQRALAEHRKQHGFSPTVRIGIHAAEATRRGQDFSGAEVHKAARVADAAEAGEILVTEAVLAEAGEDAKASEPRELILQGVEGPVAVAAIDWR